jgi:hypothetical protein
MKYRVLNSAGAHAFFATEDELAKLVRAGFGRTFGTRRNVRGMKLTATVADAGALLFGNTGAASRLGTFREHIANRFYIFQHRQPTTPGAAAHLALAA